jgi:hypothetical protein
MACPNDMSIPIWDDSAIAIDIAGNIIGKIKATIGEASLGSFL